MRAWPVELRSIGLVTCGATAWRHGGRSHLSVIVKATFAFAPDGPMRRIAPEELHVGEVHHEGNPHRSLAAASDLDPYRPKADVTVVGHAYVPAGSGVFGGVARLAVFRGEVLFDLSLHVTGSRALGSTSPVERVPLLYERALGGIGFVDNPVGTDGAPGAPLPNLVDPANRQRPIGFGPIARSWPARARLLGATPVRALDAAIAELPDDFDWSYFQAAPPDQQLAHLHGDEWLLLEGLHPMIRSLRTQLPSARGLGRVHRPGGVDTFVLVADALHIDTDRACCSVVWRASIDAADEKDFDGLFVELGVESAGEPVTWPASRASTPLPAKLTKMTIPEGTIEISADQIEEISRAPRDPFGKAPVMTAKPRDPEAFAGTMLLSPEPPPAALPAAPRAEPARSAAAKTSPAPKPSVPKHDFERTTDLSAFALVPGRGPNWLDLAGTGAPSSKPAEAREPAAANPSLRPLEQEPPDETMLLSVAAPPSLNAPFDIASPGAAPRTPAEPIAGAPWSAVPAAPRSAPHHDFDRTITVQSELDPSPQVPLVEAPPPDVAASLQEPLVEAPPPDVAAPPPELFAPEPKVEKPRESVAPVWSWAPQVESPAPAPEPRQRLPPPPAVTESLYTRFSKKR